MSELMSSSSSSNAMISSTAKQKPDQGQLVSLLWFPLSNPLYFSYLIFFSPYLFKLFSFLSPLFATTSLLILSLLTTTANLEQDQHFRYFDYFDESEVYKIVFDTTADTPTTSSPDYDYISDEEVVKEMTSSAPATQTLIIKEDDHHHQSADTKDVIVIITELSSPVKVKVTHKKALSSSSSSSSLADQDDQTGFASPEKSTGVNESPARENLGGSMRKEKEREWRRTLACKLFEERHSRGGGEGMDSLWETYEAENDNNDQRNDNDSNATPKNDSKKKPSKMRRNSTKSSGSMSSIGGGGKKGITENGGQISNNNNDDGGYLYGNENGGDVDDDEDWDDEGTNGKLCCLQALKFSAGKMGKPNLIKFSKAFKGIGWFHTVAKHAKKRYY